ncbi:sigma-70 family RNA polymerase sigma factor [Pedobacter frigiditerrae]|uniref:Sigma-70 family RNA polymerase sigma factor n=1 Tax=Pedobacter frigiditerrae TaxID=2530452 RepID=A0A4V6N5P4_9SPHI|nr:sigma-70 family RNA polymerase sigma factor [Pedobacter frigiditerrae]TCC89176.1 sigma-70 family RNA polymerase sigma factor [Pedobacter frigiditerrae]
MEHLGEQELLQLIRTDDYTAFEELHRRYYKSLFTLAAKKIGDQDDAYDLMQDMFIELWEKRRTFSINNPLQNYLKNRLWFKLSGYFRTKGFKEKHFRNFTDFLQQQHAIAPYMDQQEMREMDLQYEVVMEVINRTIAEMPDKMRKVFLLSRSNQYSILEIAQQLNISPKTVKNQINIALNRIRQATSDPSISALELIILIWLTIR